MTPEELTSDALLPTRHGFFTRQGGVSGGVYKSLNCGMGGDDCRESVRINRQRVASAMGVAPQNLITVRQIHSTQVVTLAQPSFDLSSRGLPDGADALVSNQKNLALAVLTADCLPVLFADAKNQVIGAAHAGWRGCLKGVLEATLEAMVALGAARESTRVGIGPAIGRNSYEVGAEFLRAFAAEDASSRHFFTPLENGRFLFDLPAYALFRLRRAGLDHASWIGLCTYADPSRFYSRRRALHAAEAGYGHMISAIRL